MLTSILGIYRKGTIEFVEAPDNVSDETPVIVTFLRNIPIDLRERGIDAVQAAELRSRLLPFASDWENPEMNIYDRYDSAKAHL